MRKLGLVVIISHFIIVLILTMHHFISHRFKPSKPIVIRTVLPTEPPKAIAAKPPKPVPAPAPAPVKKPAPAKTNKPAPAKTAPPPKKQEKAIADIAQTLKSIGEPAPQTKTVLAVPRKIPPKTEIVADIKSLSYNELLIAYLQTALELPELGEVRVQLKINEQGALLSCEIIETKSHQNAEFLKKQLPQLTYPVVDGFKGGSYTVTFRNLETY